VRPGEDWAAFTVTMAELGANYNIQCMKLFQELKAEFPCIPDSVVRQCMKQHRNDLIKCKEELARESENFAIGRYGVRINKALLSHQMDQLLKLHKELAEGKKEVDGMKSDIKVLEQELKAQDLMLQGQAPKIVVEVKQLETDIDNLRGACNQMSEKVTHLTAGKVPLGETSINFENYLTAAQTSVPESSTSGVPGAPLSSNPLLPRPALSQEMARWSCSECTFQNHPSLEACEICEMPRLVLG